MAGTYSSKLIEKIPRVGDIVSFRFERPEDYRFGAGQWFEITFASADPQEPWEHHFSHSDAPSDPWQEFTTRLRGSDFKNALDSLPIGAPVQLEGPYGAFMMSPDVERAAFLAGGIGVTCVRSILRWVAAVRAGATAADGAGSGGAAHGASEETTLALREIVLFFANHSEDAIPFESELEALAGSLPGFRVVHVLSQPGDDWQGYRGHLDQSVLAQELTDPAGWHYFVSGPPAFDKAMQDMLLAWGIDDSRIKQERFEGY
jgi:glycine betaine catabolism B